MSVVTYTTFDGELVEENRDGTILDYVPDSLGSIIMWVDETGLPVSYTPYWPYGEPWQEPEVECPFQFVGSDGYYRDLSGTYVRARAYEPEMGRWLTVDPVWPYQPSYGYALGSPTTISDPSGFQPPPPGVNYGGPDTCAMARKCNDIWKAGIRPIPDMCQGRPSKDMWSILICDNVGSLRKWCCLDLDGDGVYHRTFVDVVYWRCFAMSGQNVCDDYQSQNYVDYETIAGMEHFKPPRTCKPRPYEVSQYTGR